jgi:hypothetical protein
VLALWTVDPLFGATEPVAVDVVDVPFPLPGDDPPVDCDPVPPEGGLRLGRLGV